MNRPDAGNLQPGPDTLEASARERPSPTPSDPSVRSVHEPERQGETIDFKSVAPVAESSVEEGLPAGFGRYKVQGVLGRGGFGTVYLGYDEQLERKVAIKVPRIG